MRIGFFAVLVQVVVYTLVYIFLTMGDGRPFKPWLRIPDEEYYSYNRFFLAPTMILSWILASAVVHILSQSFFSKGNFENTLAMFGLSVGVASWATGLHDLVTSFLGAAGVIDQQHYELLLNTPTVWRTQLWVQMLLYVAWFIMLFSKSVRVSYRNRWGASVFLGVVGFIVYQGFFFIFNR